MSFPKFQRTGVRPNRNDLWIKSYTRKDGTPIDQTSAKASTPPESGASKTRPQLFGPKKRGRIRGLGFGTTSTNIFGSSSSRTIPPLQEIVNLKKK